VRERFEEYARRRKDTVERGGDDPGPPYMELVWSGGSIDAARSQFQPYPDWSPDQAAVA
jgi:hypothetical protein